MRIIYKEGTTGFRIHDSNSTFNSSGFPNIIDEQKKRKIRSNSNSNKLYEGRVSRLMRRVHGEENAHVRRARNELENSSYRSQTGLPKNPSFKVPYVNHPYDFSDKDESSEQQQRRLNEGGSFRRMRITVITDAMELERNAYNSAEIDFVKNHVLPATIDFWESSLSVVPVAGNLKIDRDELAGRQYCGDSDFSTVPSSHIADGVPDTDLILYVSARPSTKFCGPSTLAVAVACNFDQYDRPIAGAINFCLDQVELDSTGSASASVIQDNVDVAVHEAAHILAMSSNSYRFYYDSETGRPRSKRPFSSISVTCVDGQERATIVPSENTLKFFIAANGQRYASIVTPKVLSVVRNQFDCQEIEGAPLENQPTGSQSCTGDHWEERLFYPEALSGVISPTTNILSPLTLALMEDSGWYQANYTNSNVSPWGHGAGCDFVYEKCVTTQNGKAVVPDYARGYFCTEANMRGCSPAHTHKMACTVIDYSLYFPPNPPPASYQYFPNEPTWGGPRQADFCPLYGSVYSGVTSEKLDCSIAANSDIINIFGEYYGENSKCFQTTTGEGRCYQAQCIKSERVLKVKLRNVWVTCEKDFEEKAIKSSSGVFDGTLICPRLSSVCPDLFCPANCAGRGVCDFNHMSNGTIQPKCNCFNESDTSPGCSESLILDGSYLEDSSALTDLINESFFDPLVSVFVDHPDTWERTTWIWAGGLFVIFLLMIFCICASFWPQKKKRRKKRYYNHNNRRGRSDYR